MSRQVGVFVISSPPTHIYIPSIALIVLKGLCFYYTFRLRIPIACAIARVIKSYCSLKAQLSVDKFESCNTFIILYVLNHASFRECHLVHVYGRRTPIVL